MKPLFQLPPSWLWLAPLKHSDPRMMGTCLLCATNLTNPHFVQPQISPSMLILKQATLSALLGWSPHLWSQIRPKTATVDVVTVQKRALISFLFNSTVEIPARAPPSEYCRWSRICLLQQCLLYKFDRTMIDLPDSEAKPVKLCRKNA